MSDATLTEPGTDPAGTDREFIDENAVVDVPHDGADDAGNEPRRDSGAGADVVRGRHAVGLDRAHPRARTRSRDRRHRALETETPGPAGLGGREEFSAGLTGTAAALGVAPSWNLYVLWTPSVTDPAADWLSTATATTVTPPLSV